MDQDSTIFVNFENHTSWPTAIHWHGLRLDNAFDGVPHLTQDPVPPGGRFEYRLFFPDAGLYWYHPHHREEVQQDLGLYGNMLVEAPPDTWYAPVHREEILMLDDLLIADDGGLFPFGTERATHSLMGRFGNLMLVNGEPEYALGPRPGRGRPLLPHERLEHPDLQPLVRRAGHAPHQGRRVRPLEVRARDVGGFGGAGARRALHRGGPLRDRRGARPGEPGAPAGAHLRRLLLAGHPAGDGDGCGTADARPGGRAGLRRTAGERSGGGGRGALPAATSTGSRTTNSCSRWR